MRGVGQPTNIRSYSKNELFYPHWHKGRIRAKMLEMYQNSQNNNEAHFHNLRSKITLKPSPRVIWQQAKPQLIVPIKLAT